MYRGLGTLKYSRRIDVSICVALTRDEIGTRLPDDVKIALPDLFSRVCNLAICDRKVNAPPTARLITYWKCACMHPARVFSTRVDARAHVLDVGEFFSGRYWSGLILEVQIEVPRSRKFLKSNHYSIISSL